MMVESYYEILSPYNYEAINEASISFMRSNPNNGFPPNPAQIIEAMSRLESLVSNEMNPEQAFELVAKAVSNSGNNSVEEFNKLPELVQRVVVSPSTLRDWAYDESGNFKTVYKAQFMRAYRELLLKEKDLKKNFVTVEKLKNQIALQEEQKPILIEEKKETENPVVPVKQKREHKAIKDLLAELTSHLQPVR